LGIQYRTALGEYRESSLKAPFQADAAVRCKDRLPASTLKLLSGELRNDLHTLLEQQAHSRSVEQRNQPISIVALFFTLSAFAYWMTSRNISNPLGHTLASVKRLTSGDAQTTVTRPGRKDEIGDLAEAFEYFRKNTQSAVVGNTVSMFSVLANGSVIAGKNCSLVCFLIIRNLITISFFQTEQASKTTLRSN